MQSALQPGTSLFYGCATCSVYHYLAIPTKVSLSLFENQTVGRKQKESHSAINRDAQN